MYSVTDLARNSTFSRSNLMQELDLMKIFSAVTLNLAKTYTTYSSLFWDISIDFFTLCRRAVVSPKVPMTKQYFQSENMTRGL